MTDPRIAIVREWAVTRARVDRPFGMPDTATGHYAELLAKLDSARPEPTGDEVERVANAVWLDRFPDVPWPPANEQDADDYRGHARAALSALPPSGALGLAREAWKLLSPASAASTVAARGVLYELIELLERSGAK